MPSIAYVKQQGKMVYAFDENHRSLGCFGGKLVTYTNSTVTVDNGYEVEVRDLNGRILHSEISESNPLKKAAKEMFSSKNTDATSDSNRDTGVGAKRDTDSSGFKSRFVTALWMGVVGLVLGITITGEPISGIAFGLALFVCILFI